MSNLEDFIKKINNNLEFINYKFKLDIINFIKNYLPVLNEKDINIIINLTIFIIDIISYKYNFLKNDEYYHQWKQNNNRDIKGVILLLLPFINEKEDNLLLNKLVDLNQLLYSNVEKEISNTILKLERTDAINKYFKFGNMAIGLLDENNKYSLLKLYDDNNEKLIYKLIYHNILGLLQTLEIMNGKYYINWINIIPINISNYQKLDFYKKTKDTIIKENILDIINNKLLLYYSGLWIGDIYNLFRIRFYDEIKRIKWLIFPYETNEIKLYLIHGLHKMVNINDILNNDIYENLKLEQQNKFNLNIKKILFNLKNKISLVNYFPIDIEIIKYYLIYVINNNEIKNNNIIKKFKLDIENENINDDFDKKDIKIIQDINLIDIISCLEIISDNHIYLLWNYLKKSLDYLITTAFSKYLIIKKNNLLELNENYNFSLLNMNISTKLTINLKNIYNISKSLCHIENKDKNEWILLDNNYLSLNNENKKLFFEKLFGMIDNSWLNLKNNIKKQKFNYNKDKYSEYIAEILIDFNNIYLKLIFEDLIVSGILSQFKLNVNITDNSLLPKNILQKNKKIEKLLSENFNNNKDEWLKSYYYLNNDRFENLPLIRFEKDKDKYDQFNKNVYQELSYFNLISKDHKWPMSYAMDWISQISFFQHYIYHQILYVTGATGQGKSLQVPKLFLYALKVIDYKYNGKVICTVPRRQPLLDNSKRIAEELGVPIDMLSNTSNIKIKTDNFYMQYKYKEDSHTKNVNHGFIKIVTDGTLLEEIKMNPTMFEKKDNKYINKVLYDVIFIDEAHEHGSNMDLIITLARQTCYFNNKVRLIIVSATMDDDEPIYRRYFKYINDKLLYPIKYNFFDPILEKSILLNSDYMDRRYHISPPGETSQFKIDEIYLNNDFDKLTEDENANLAQEKGYEKIIEICKTTATGQILLFSNGQKEILNAVKYLNSNTPSTCIALPFFSELHQNYKNYISKIDITISKIKNKKENIFNEWRSEFIEDKSVPDNIYKRAIIIATNVAEASVTIKDLYYVVDNGYAKVNKYLPKLNLTKLLIEKISEASRVQRKGRVGRIGNGTVYYMYKKDARKNIKPKYKITEEDPSEKIISLLCDKEINKININDFINYDDLIISNICNPNFYRNISQSSLSINGDIILNKINTYKSGLRAIYYKNYIINSNYLESNYFYNYSDYYTENINKMIEKISDTDINNILNKYIYRNESGQLLYNLLDQNGKFYLIHPFENYIKRNILNNIIFYNNEKKNIISIESYKYILSDLSNKNLLIDMNLNYLSNNTFKNFNMTNYFKSELVNKIMDLKSDFEFDKIENAITMISASAMNCEIEVFEIIILIQTIDSIKNIIRSDLNWNTFLEKYKIDNYKSDILFLYDIIKNLKKEFNNLLIFNMNTPYLNDLINNQINLKFDKFSKYIKSKSFNSIFEPPNLNFNSELWNKLISIKNESNIVNLCQDEYKKVIIKYDNDIINILKNNILLYSKQIIIWADNIYLNGNILIKFLDKLADNYIKFIINTDRYESFLQKNKIINWSKILYFNYYKNLTEYSIEEKIIRSFIYGKPLQFIFKLSNNKNITMINNYSLCYLSFEESLIDSSEDYLFYINYKENTDESNDIDFVEKDLIEFNKKKINISFLSHINIKWLFASLPLFINPSININNILNNFSYNITNFKKDLANSWNSNYLIFNIPELPLLQYYYNNIFVQL
uniref:Helicase ATP-binding domain-containing protein n=1 Tax=viral metagenome TaxID=1070528 RepID=A0A6C0EDB6_9ZZZZ